MYLRHVMHYAQYQLSTTNLVFPGPHDQWMVLLNYKMSSQCQQKIQCQSFKWMSEGSASEHG